MNAHIENGWVVRVPRGTDIFDYTKTVQIRKPRVGIVEWSDAEYVGVITAQGKAFRIDRGVVEIVDRHDHTLHVTRHNLGGHPIAGWNWPVWGYDYRCECGESLGDREDYQIHLEDEVGS